MDQTDWGIDSLQSGSRRGITRRDFLKVTAAGIVLAACGDTDEATTTTTVAPVTTTTAPVAAPTGTVRYLNAENFWADWQPYGSPALAQLRLERQVYDYLIDFPTGDISQEPQPMLATAVRRVDDVTWEFELRDGVTFHEGQAFTAEDVKASVKRASGLVGDPPAAFSFLWKPAQVEVVDRLTARIKTEQPYAPMLAQLWWMPIISAETAGGDPDRLAAQPNGTGPFRLVNDELEKKTMEANLDYWRDPPKIKTLIWEFVQDAQIRANALLAGDAQAIDRVPPEQIAQLRDEAGVELITTPLIEQVNLWVRGRNPGTETTRFPLWEENANFRRAVNWSFDREPLVDNLLLGAGDVATSNFPATVLGHAPQEPRYRFDPAKVEEELAAGGITDGGPEFEIWVAAGFLPRIQEVTEAIVSQMQQVGLNPKIVTSDVTGSIGDVVAEGGTGAMYTLVWSGSGDPNWAAAVYSSSFFWWFGDDTLQGLIDQGQATLDPAQKNAIYADVQRRLWEQAYHVPLYYPNVTLAHSANLQGILAQPNVQRTDFYTAELGA